MSTQANFEAFHAKHPEVYGELVRLARQARARGRKVIGIKMLWEVARWHLNILGGVDPEEEYKLNNNYHSRYARMIMDQEHDLAGIFRLRELKS